MSAQLDLDDVAEQSELAKKELAVLRSEIEAMQLYTTQLKQKMKRLQKIEYAAIKVVQQTNPDRAYALHDYLILVLDAGS